jgi:hypothetical protein
LFNKWSEVLVISDISSLDGDIMAIPPPTPLLLKQKRKKEEEERKKEHNSSSRTTAHFSKK